MLPGGSSDCSQQTTCSLAENVANSDCTDVCPQVDAEGAGALGVPHALANMGHGLCRIHVCLLFP